MDTYTIDDVLLERIRSQFRLWAMFLNNGIGFVSFTLGLACLGTPTPWVNAGLSVVFVALIRQQGKHYFPQDIEELRNAAKENEKARILLRGLEGEFLSVKALVSQYPIFLLGFIFLMLIMFSPGIAKWSAFFSTYFGS